VGDSIALWVLGFLTTAGAAGGAVGIFNSLVQVRNNVEKAFANIDVLLQQRHDELPMLVDVCKAFLRHERSLLEELTSLRAGYDRASRVDEKVRIENRIQADLEKLRFAVEAYPELVSHRSVLELQERVSALESSIADRREFFNESVNVYNIQIEQFPHRLLAALLRYVRRPMLEVAPEARRDVKLAFA
jgi:LemA protein